MTPEAHCLPRAPFSNTWMYKTEDEASNTLHWETYSSHSNRLIVYQHACTNTSEHMVSFLLKGEQPWRCLLSVWHTSPETTELNHREDSFAWVYKKPLSSLSMERLIPTCWQMSLLRSLPPETFHSTKILGWQCLAALHIDFHLPGRFYWCYLFVLCFIWGQVYLLNLFTQ